MSRGFPLKFFNMVVERNCITFFPRVRFYDCANGTVFLNNEGILIGAKCSKTIPNNIGQDLLAIYLQMEKHWQFLMREKQVANVCANFVVAGLREDNKTKLKMSHSPKLENSAFLEMEMWSKLWVVFWWYIYRIVRYEFGWLFQPIIHWLNLNKVEVYANFGSSVTAGKLFGPHLHTEPDVWYKVLVCIDYVERWRDRRRFSICFCWKCDFMPALWCIDLQSNTLSRHHQIFTA